MNIGLRIEDFREHMLNPALPGGYGLTSLDGFFRFWHWERHFSDPQPFRDCFFYDLHLDPPATPTDALRDPRIFECCFPLILKRLVGESNILTLFVKSLDPGYFDEFAVIRTLLAPRHLRYVLLPNPILPGSSMTAIDVGHLVFEWPVAESERIAEDWFMCPQVEIEGYVGPTLPLGRIADLYFQPDTESRVRELLSGIEFGFRLDTDFNSLTVLTDKLDMQAMENRLQLPTLIPALSLAVRSEAGGSP